MQVKSKAKHLYALLPKIRQSFYFTVLYVSLFVWQIVTDWPLLRYWQIRGTLDFGDLSAVVKLAKCYSSLGLSVYQNGVTESCKGYLYGETLLKIINVFHIGMNQVSFLAIIYIVFSCIIFGVLSALLFKSSRLLGFLSPLLFFSPVTILLAERANFDSLIFIMITIVAIMNTKHYRVAFLLLSLAALFKYYSTPLLAYFLLEQKRLAFRLMFSGITLMIALIVYRNIQRVEAVFFDAVGGGFGNMSLGLWIRNNGFPISSLGMNLIGISALGFVWLVLRKFSNSKADLVPGTSEKLDKFILFHGSIFVSCYLMGMNFDYRLIFGISAGVALLLGIDLSKKHRILVMIALVVISWSSYNAAGVIQFFGDFHVLVLVMFLLNYISVYLVRNFSISRRLRKSPL